MPNYKDVIVDTLVSPNNFNEDLTSFKKIVIEDKIERISYEDWKHMMKLVKQGCSILLSLYSNDTLAIGSIQEPEKFYDIKTHSFARFLRNRYFYNIETSSKDDSNNNSKKENKKEKKEEKSMMNKFNFNFGPCTNKDNVKVSMYGLAVKNSLGVWVSYNPQTGELVDVDCFNFDGANFLFKMPVAVKDIAVGDVIMHNKVPMFVLSVDNGIFVVDPKVGEEKKILPTTNMFGFNFVTKVISLFNTFGKAPTSDNPFGNLLPFMLMSDEGNAKLDPMMLMLMLNSGNMSMGTDMFSNPMMLYFLMNGESNDNNKMLPLMMMMNQQQTNLNMYHQMDQNTQHQCKGNCANCHQDA